MKTFELTAIGNSTGVIFPKGLLEKLRVSKGNIFTVTETPRGVEISAYDQKKAHQRELAEHGGQDGIRDEGMLLPALSGPKQLFQYGDPPPDLCALAASYAFGLAKNHPFVDGNKRTAAVACELFLLLNGLLVTVSEEEKRPHYLNLASGEHNEEGFAKWLREVTAKI